MPFNNGMTKGEAIMSTSTVRLHRVLRAAPEKLYRAFLDPDAMAKWLPPNGFTGKVHHVDAKVGGTYRMSFTNFTTGHSHSFGGKYLELGATRTHSSHGHVRRPGPTRRNADDGIAEEGVLRH
jgi:activator of Hsp90 ATPase-like protein